MKTKSDHRYTSIVIKKAYLGRGRLLRSRSLCSRGFLRRSSAGLGGRLLCRSGGGLLRNNSGFGSSLDALGRSSRRDVLLGLESVVGSGFRLGCLGGGGLLLGGGGFLCGRGRLLGGRSHILLGLFLLGLSLSLRSKLDFATRS